MNKAIFAVLHLAAAGQLLFVKPAHGLTFNFNWTSDAPGLRILNPDEGASTVTVSGTFEADVPREAGQMIIPDKISSFNRGAVRKEDASYVNYK